MSKVKLLFLYVLVSQVLVISPLSANEQKKSENDTQKYEAKSSPISKSQDAIQSESSIDQQVQLLQLKKLTDKQMQLISDLETRLDEKNSDSFKFEFWMGVMLTGITLLLTILGLGIAILSIFGFRKVLTTSAQKATKVAISTAESKANEVAHEAVDKQLIKYIEDGRFDKIINFAVEKQIYRGIGQTNNFDDEQ
ncbi:hypothetical protein Q4602_14940 [Paraglaciecola chathamensis]|uniref:hypothetical protein n=1 Tax=Paraglaciecola chathamensis TaxID=368405 RepID=UPI0026FE8233|nr:hypothetical protein [Paraglaciecola chathamensis]MDO6840774.1 hypothetical protein [Paraglaciecola chathamensis]